MYKFDGDTLAAGKQYKKLWVTMDSTQTLWTYEGAMREDSSKKVYSLGNPGDFLYYDFNLQKSDTFITQIDICSLTISYVVDSIDTITLLNGEQRKRYLLDWGIHIWIEGIGDLNGLHEMGTMHCMTDIFPTLNCFTEDSILKLHNTPYNCYVNLTAINEINAGRNWSLQPNPFNDFAMLTFDNPANETATLQLYNARGQLVRAINNITSSPLKISRRNLNSGIYFFNLVSDKKQIAKGKFVIE